MLAKQRGNQRASAASCPGLPSFKGLRLRPRLGAVDREVLGCSATNLRLFKPEASLWDPAGPAVWTEEGRRE